MQNSWSDIATGDAGAAVSGAITAYLITSGLRPQCILLRAMILDITRMDANTMVIRSARYGTQANISAGVNSSHT